MLSSNCGESCNTWSSGEDIADYFRRLSSQREEGLTICSSSVTSAQLPQAFSDKDWAEREYLPLGRSEYILSINVKKITVQPNKYKPLSLDPVELEILRLKRAVVSMDVEEDSKEAKVAAVVEFRGKGLTLSVTEGDCDVGQVVWRLSKFHLSRYGRSGVRILSPPHARKLCDCTLENPDDFVSFLHLIQTNGGVTIQVWNENSTDLRGIRQMESFKLGSKEEQTFP